MPTTLSLRLPLLIASLAGAGFARAGGASFQGIGFLPGGSESSLAALSSDGSVAAGYSTGRDGNRQAVRFGAGTLAGLGFLPNVNGNVSEANAISSDGSIVAGSSFSSYNRRAALFANGAVTDLGVPPGTQSSQANALSGNGSIAAGWGYDFFGDYLPYRGAIFAGGAAIVPGSTDGPRFDRIQGLSSDGSVAVGRRLGLGYSQALRYQNGTMTLLGFLPGDPLGNVIEFSEAYAVSANGGVAVGFSYTNIGDDQFSRAVRFVDGNVISLGVPTGATDSGALAVSEDGTVAAGYSGQPYGSGHRAAIFDIDGAKDLTQLLDASGALPTGWTLTEALAVKIAPSGERVIAGYGTDPEGRKQGYIARIAAPVPEPATWAALGFGALALLRRRR